MISFLCCSTKTEIEKYTTGWSCSFTIGVYSRGALSTNLTRMHIVKRESCFNEAVVNVKVLLTLLGSNKRWRLKGGSMTAMGSMYRKAMYGS